MLIWSFKIMKITNTSIINHFKFIKKKRKKLLTYRPGLIPTFDLLMSEVPELRFSFPSLAVILQWLVWRKYFEWRIWASLVPIVGGILLTSVTELSFNVFGFCAALVGCLATSTKTILAESLLHGYKFDRFLLLSRLSIVLLKVLMLVKVVHSINIKKDN